MSFQIYSDKVNDTSVGLHNDKTNVNEETAGLHMDRMNCTANEDVTDLEEVTNNLTNSLKSKFFKVS